MGSQCNPGDSGAVPCQSLPTKGQPVLRAEALPGASAPTLRPLQPGVASRHGLQAGKTVHWRSSRWRDRQSVGMLKAQYSLLCPCLPDPAWFGSDPEWVLRFSMPAGVQRERWGHRRGRERQRAAGSGLCTFSQWLTTLRKGCRVGGSLGSHSMRR